MKIISGMMLFVQMKSTSVTKFCPGTIDLDASNVFISIQEAAMCGHWAAEWIQPFFISTWTLIKGNRKELLDLSALKIIKEQIDLRSGCLQI